MVLFLAALFSLTASAQEKVDLNVVYKTKQEAFRNSQVMEHLHGLSDLNGPRLTASPQFNKAAEWTMARFREMGLDSVHLEKWGPFGRSWSVDQYSVEMVAPSYAVLNARPMAWATGTKGTVTGDVYFAPIPITTATGSIETPQKYGEELDRYFALHKGKLKGKIVLLWHRTEVPNAAKADFRRLSQTDLGEIAESHNPIPRKPVDIDKLEWPEDPEVRNALFDNLPFWAQMRIYSQFDVQQNRLNKFFNDEGVLGVIQSDQRAVNGVVFSEAGGSYKSADPSSPPKFVLAREPYNRIVRLVEHKQTVRVRLNLQVTQSANDVDANNIVAEIPGSSKPSEVVLIGAHFDSWHTGTGATDNGTGSSVMIEAMRILKALSLKMDRTVRIALWSGEEQGMYGSENYIRQHFGNPETMKLTDEHAKLSVYFNHDNGTGKIRGVYLQENDAARPVFEALLAPFKDMGVTTISIRNAGGTDHLSFDAIGIPGFQFVQDPADYSTKTHHSDLDVYDHAVPDDLRQASAVIASLVYHAANRPDMWPRKPLPPALRK